MKKRQGLESSWIGGYDDGKVIGEDCLVEVGRGIMVWEVREFKGNRGMVILDGWYNGDLGEKDQIGGGYMMWEGKWVSSFGN